MLINKKIHLYLYLFPRFIYFFLKFSSQASFPSGNKIYKKKKTNKKNFLRVAVYRFPGIRIGVLLARAKLLQTMASVMLVPYTYWQYLNEAVTLHFLGGVTMLAVVATSMLMLFSRFVFFYTFAIFFFDCTSKLLIRPEWQL